jgi:AbrB family looped-hinge helix DNA binding protein
MKATVTLSSRGVISLPAKVRTELGLKADDVLLLETTSEGILLRPAATLPIEIYDEARIREFDEEESALEPVLRKSKKRRPV